MAATTSTKSLVSADLGYLNGIVQGLELTADDNFTVEEEWFELEDGCCLYIETWSRRDVAPERNAVYMPGGSRAMSDVKFIKKLCRNGFRVMAFNGRGAGQEGGLLLPSYKDKENELKGDFLDGKRIRSRSIDNDDTAIVHPGREIKDTRYLIETFKARYPGMPLVYFMGDSPDHKHL